MQCLPCLMYGVVDVDVDIVQKSVILVPASASASAVLRCRTKTGVDAAGMSAQRSMNRTARSPDGSGKHQLKERQQRRLPNDSSRLWF